MSIALDRNHHEVANRFLNRSKMGPCDLSILRDRTVVIGGENRENGYLDSCSSSSSSIGRNSDDDDEFSANSDEEDGDEVESKLKKTHFNSAMDALEEALPIRRGISKFYNGKSKSFASLGDAACSSIKDITKQENAYTRKRRNLLACSILYDKGRNSMLKSPGLVGGISKRSMGSNRSTLALAVAMSNGSSTVEESGSSPETSRRSKLGTPPMSPWRSFSLVDLQNCAAASASASASVISSNLSSPLMGKRNKTR